MFHDRRTFLKTTLASVGAAALPLPRLGRSALAAGGAEPHFFLLATILGGMDATYMFDARPLAMTTAGLVANYLGEEPQPWTGRNGQTTLATRLTAPLAPYRDQFSVINGVVMAASFDGHPQNLNYLFTGNPFGGDSFVPHLNGSTPTPARPLDYVQTGSLYADLTNAGSSMPMTAASAKALVARLKTSAPLAASDRVFGFMQGRMRADGTGQGRFSAAARLMDGAAGAAPGLDASLRALNLPAEEGGELASAVRTAAQFFKAGITPCAVLSLVPEGMNQTPDTHGPDQAKASAAIVGSIAGQLAKIFETLKATPYDATRSMLDMTTVVAATEFSRSMRQIGLPLDATGTDHNPLNNSVLIGGKGIKGGLVIGESDTRDASEVLSASHLALDPARLKVMGKPFDFAAMAPRQDKPAVYAAQDHLLFSSVANTIYQLFGVEPAQYWVNERGGATAPVLGGLLA